ncbi:hypothetical protein KI659_16700 [Litoribacter alkaliphilus]|uniref:Uncharacterized protein n=1 Tax=Litoribacter ruber TaxID=702568 RepID=A0AAP2CN93_9BACT|nr:hypothetical protein [Litoribacter alkaliphilus]MBS9525660.1 hypothetical protein [Litoribacter alkaliphilus]
MKEITYPSFYELKEVLENLTNKSFNVAFGLERGIIISRSNHANTASELAYLFYDKEDIDEIRNEAYRRNTNHTLSGFQIKSESSIELPSVFESIISTGNIEIGQSLSSLTEEYEGKTKIFTSMMEYRKRKIGRIEFLQEETINFKFNFFQIDQKTWQVEVDCVRSNDLGEIKKIFEKNLSRETDFEEIELNSLTTEKTINFFDSLANKFDENWTFKDIKHLTLKRGSENDEDIIDVSSREEDQESDNLSGITQAILEGKNLRENSFVKNSVENGYKFTSMTYEFDHSTEPKTIQIKAEFKGRPKIFETSIINFMAKTGLGAESSELKINQSQKRKYCSMLWNAAKETYYELLK